MELVWYFSTLLFRKADGIEIIQKFNGKYLTGPYLILQFFSDKGCLQTANKLERKKSLYDAIFTYFGSYYSPVCFYKYVESP